MRPRDEFVSRRFALEPPRDGAPTGTAFPRLRVHLHDTTTGARSQPAGRDASPRAGRRLPRLRDRVRRSRPMSSSVRTASTSTLPPSAAHAIAELRRDALTSVLSQPAGRKACISGDGSASSTTGQPADYEHAGFAFKQPIALTLTPDGRHAPTVDFAGLTLWNFVRNATGALAFPTCWSGVAGLCATLRLHGMQAPIDVVLSANGRDAYVASKISGGLAVLTRDANGSITQPPFACLTNDGGDRCVQAARSRARRSEAVARTAATSTSPPPTWAGSTTLLPQPRHTGVLHPLDGLERAGVTYHGAAGSSARASTSRACRDHREPGQGATRLRCLGEPRRDLDLQPRTAARRHPTGYRHRPPDPRPCRPARAPAAARPRPPSPASRAPAGGSNENGGSAGEHIPDQVQRVQLEEDGEHERSRGHDHDDGRPRDELRPGNVPNASP